MKTAQQAFDLSKQATDYNSGKYFTQGQKAGAFGGLTTDPTTGAQTQQFGAGLLPSVNNTQGALGQQTAGLPAGFNFDMTTPQGIAMGNYGAYSAMAAPQREQMQDQWKTTLAERGIPLGSDIEQQGSGNMARQFSIADTNAAAQAWNAVPGMQAQMTNTELQQKYAPANQNLAQLQGLYGLLPNINQPQLGAAQAGNVDYTNLVNNNYNQQMQQYNANQAALGGLFGGAAKWAMSPVNPGGFAATNLGNMFS